MQLDFLRYFQEMENHPSISETAKYVGISQPALSNAIKALEEEYKIHLIQKTKEGIELTREGKVLIAHAKIINGKLAILKQHVEEEEAGYIGFNLGVCMNKMLQIEEPFRQLFNNVHTARHALSVKETSNEACIRYVASGQYELGLVAFGNTDQGVWENLLELNNLTFQEVTCTHWCVLVGKKQSVAKETTITRENLQQMAMLYLMKRELYEESYMFKSCFEDWQDGRKTLCITDKHTVESMLTTGDFYTIVPYVKGLETEHIEAIPIVIEDFHIKIGWIRKLGEPLSDEAKQLMLAVASYHEMNKVKATF